jgi:hypothetical protein
MSDARKWKCRIERGGQVVEVSGSNVSDAVKGALAAFGVETLEDSDE